MSRVLPSVTDLTSLLSSLTGRAVHLKATPPYVFANDKAALVAAWHDLAARIGPRPQPRRPAASNCAPSATCSTPCHRCRPTGAG